MQDRVCISSSVIGELVASHFSAPNEVPKSAAPRAADSTDIAVV